MTFFTKHGSIFVVLFFVNFLCSDVKNKKLFLAILLLTGCLSPVRREIFTKRTPVPAEAQTEEAAPLKPAETERFKDTVVIAPATSGSDDADITGRVAQADELFKKKKIRQACDMYDQLAQTIAEGDSLDYEVRFMLSECAAENQDFKKSLSILKELAIADGIPNAVLEKALVRLGQVNCVLEKKNDAEAAFTLLKKQFPKSAYLKLATCDVVK